MADGNRATVHVDLAQFGPDLVLPGQDDAGKSFVDLHEVNLADGEASFCQNLARGWNRCGQLCADALMSQAVVVAFEHQRAEGCARTLSGCAYWNSGHSLDTASNHNIVCAAEYALRCKVNGLLARSTLTVNRRTGDRFGK